MFTQPCFIRKRNLELIRELERFGYICKQSMIQPISHVLVVMNDSYSCSFPYNCYNNERFIDCMNNDDLFLAIAALRDDTDKNQWFTNGDDWILCDFLHLSEHFYFYKIDKIDLDIDSMHKATVEELIEHFKDK